MSCCSWRWWTGKKLEVIGVLVAVLAFVVGVPATIGPWRDLWCDTECRAVEAVYAERNFTILAEGRYHRRAVEEAELAAFFRSSLKNNRYLIVVGPRGCGKSTVVRAATSGQHGVIHTSFATGTKLDQAYNLLLAEIGVSDYAVSNEKAVAKLFRKVQQQKVPNDPTWRPIVVVEFDRGVEDNLIATFTPSLKKLGTDEQAAHVVLVLSDANAVFALKPDEGRQHFLWVGDLTVDEANDVLDRFGHLHCHHADNATATNCTLRARIFEQLGTRMLDVVAAAAHLNVEAYIQQRISLAVGHFNGLTSPKRPVGADFARLVCALLEDPQHHVSDDVATTFLPSPEEATKYLKAHHALLFHTPSRTWQFYSVAHLNAAKVWSSSGKCNLTSY